VELARVRGLEAHFWRAQNAFHRAWQRLEPGRLESGGPWVEAFVRLGERLGFRLPAAPPGPAAPSPPQPLPRGPARPLPTSPPPSRRTSPPASPFRDAAALARYLAGLGLSAVYASPLFLARPGSTHGYDVCDHRRLNPELGADDDFRDFAAALREHGLGLILD